MYKFLTDLLTDKKGDVVFTCFGMWHWGYILVTVLLAGVAIWYLVNKNRQTQKRVINGFINMAFALYMADFFLMPFAYGKIDIEKLPFHICTAMCVMCFWSRHAKPLKKYRVHLALLGFLSNFVYLIYPAGVMWYEVHPLCYRVVQTLLFHGIMTVYGLLVLLFEMRAVNWRKCYRDLIILVGMTLWAIFGNLLYLGNEWIPGGTFNWFFTMRDPFYLFPADIAPYVMPFLNVTIFFAAELLLYGVLWLLKRGTKQREE